MMVAKKSLPNSSCVRLLHLCIVDLLSHLESVMLGWRHQSKVTTELGVGLRL